MPLPALLAQQVLTDAEQAACGRPEEASALCLALFRWTNNDTVARLSDVIVVKPAKILLIVLLAVIGTRVLRRAIDRFVRTAKGEKVRSRLTTLKERAPNALVDTSGGAVPNIRAAQRAETIGALLRSVGTFVIWGLALLTVLSELGINLGPLIAGAGIVGIALGFGAQSMVKDFLSGIFMLIEDQYGVGDVIDAGEANGTVEAVSLRTTRLRDVNGVVWHVPNGQITRIGNKSQQWSRALLDIEVAYDTDLDHASRVILETAKALAAEDGWKEEVLEEPELWGVELLGASGISIRLVVKTQPASQWKVSRELRARIKARFEQEGIEIPFPQQVVWHRTADGRPVQPPAPATSPPDEPPPRRRAPSRARGRPRS